MHLIRPITAACALAAVAVAQTPPSTPTITEPGQAGSVLNPSDVHMETAPFADPDPGDGHRSSTWEIWTINPSQRVWIADDVTGLEKVHAHLGDGVFENSHAGLLRLLNDTDFELRVRHRDDSGDPASEWSAWATRAFSTGAASIEEPLVLADVLAAPAPTWTDSQGAAIDLPVGAPLPTLRLETDTRWQLLRIDAAAGPGNTVHNPGPLPVHRPVRVVVKAGNPTGVLSLPPSRLRFHTSGCERVDVFLPAITLPPNGAAYFWVGAHGATFVSTPSAFVPDFGSLARTVPVPWAASRAGYRVEVVAEGLHLPVNIAFAPSQSALPNAPKFYVTELHGTIKVVTNAGFVLDYATNVINYTPSNAFPGSGEQGLTGIAVDPVTGDVFASHLWRSGSQNYPRITRFSSNNGGLSASSSQVILDMPGESQGQSHQISRLEIVAGELFCHMGDGFNAATAQNLNSYRGKILRMDLNGAPLPTNPFYNGGTITSRDYIWCRGVRNPFGGAWREADGERYMVENGPDVDRFAMLVPGRDFGWNGNGATMFQFALYAWDPSAAPVNLAFVQPATFGGSGFPDDVQGHAFVTESGATYSEGEQARGKRISELVLDAAGNVVAGPLPFVDYVGDGYATAVALAAGPDGLYFSELYSDGGTAGPTTSGARILRVVHGDPEDCDGNGQLDACELQNGAPDLDGNSVLDRCDPLQADIAEASISVLGQVQFTLRAGVEHAGHDYQLLGSMTGTAPGTPVGALTLPLNSANDPWYALTQMVFSPVILQNTLGALDAAGEAQATLLVPPLPSLLGLQFHHAYVVTDAQSMAPRFVSNAVPLLLVQ